MEEVEWGPQPGQQTLGLGFPSIRWQVHLSVVDARLVDPVLNVVLPQPLLQEVGEGLHGDSPQGQEPLLLPQTVLGGD